MRANVILSLLCAAVAGCGVSSVVTSDRNIKEALAETDVVGRWNITSNSLSLLRRDGFSPAATNRFMIVFATNGTCLFQSVQSFAGKNQYISTSGTWKLEHDTRGDSNIEKKNAIRIEFSSARVGYTEYLNFARENGVLILWNYYGDPDEWQFIEYERER